MIKYLVGENMLYTSIDNKKIKEIKKLHQKKYRDKTGLFLVEGEHLVLEAFKMGYLEELILEQDTLFPLDIKNSYVTNDIIYYISEVESPQNVMGICRKRDKEEIIGNRLLLLDGIQDPGNLGTIIRSAVAFHTDMIILGSGTVDLYNPKVIRSSQGMVFHIPIIEADLVTLLPTLKDEGYQIMGTRVTHGKSLKTLEKKIKSAIIMGNEGNGISDSVADYCDEFLYIDMNSKCESLNVGVATSIILYELDK